MKRCICITTSKNIEQITEICGENNIATVKLIRSKKFFRFN